MELKIAVSGKGGVGKSTIAGILAHYFAKAGYHVLAVDSDPDANLASALGIPGPEAAKIVPISRQRELIKERTGASPRQFGQLFKLNPRVDDIPADFALEFRGIKLLVMGGVRKGGEGCACPENVLLKSLLSEILLGRDEAVIIDMEAGIEHLGRATAAAVRDMVIVVEPGSRSIATAGMIVRLSREIGIGKFHIIGNKIRDEEEERWVRAQFPDMTVLGTVPFSERVREAELREVPLIDILDERLQAAFAAIFSGLVDEGEAAG